MMDEKQVVSIIGRKLDAALGDDDNELSQVRQENYDYYLGKPFGNERKGYSKFVSRDVLETVEWALPSVLRVFASGDRFVEFRANGPQDEEQAAQEMDVANYIILEQDGTGGFLALHDWAKDALTMPNAYLKVYAERYQKTTSESYQGLTQEQLSQVVSDDKVKITAQEMHDGDAIDPMTGQPIQLFDIDIEITDDCVRYCMDVVPGEEVRVDAAFQGQNLDKCGFVSHSRMMSASDLRELGVDQGFLDSIGEAGDYTWMAERVNRQFFTDEANGSTRDESGDESSRMFWVHECSVKLDEDDDGIAERRRIVTIGPKVWEDEEDDYVFLINLASVLLPHRHIALSYADIVKDLQLLRSMLWRMLLDNTYRLNAPRKYVGEKFLVEGGITMDALLDATVEYVPASDPTAINAEVPTPVVQHLLPVLQGIDDMKGVRTGVTPNLNLDPEVLQQSTMGAFQTALAQASQRVEMLVRIFAETGFKQLALKVHQLMREYQDVPLTIKLRGKWVQVDPRDWKERTSAKAKVGLGNNSKETEIQLLMSLLGIQQQALPMGLTSPPKVYRTLDRLVDASGLGEGSLYFDDPSDPQVQQAQAKQAQQAQQAQAQDPSVQAVLVSAKAEMAKVQTQQAQTQADIKEMGAKLQAFMNETAARIKNIEADTILKLAQAHALGAKTSADRTDQTIAEHQAVLDTHERAQQMRQGAQAHTIEQARNIHGIRMDDNKSAIDSAQAQHGMDMSNRQQDFNEQQAQQPGAQE